ncbi:MAG: efflux RND transporter periplasmic adaptor subunit [Marinilabiliaceae bacterium]|nr:efflux RND transporter periplasmic adaptor subunit [Marinilabiliaceae bacterium]
MQVFKKRLFLILGGFVVLVVGFVYFGGGSKESQQIITYKVTKGQFKAQIYSTGQLQAEKSVPIDVPGELSSRNMRIYEIKISKLIDEGTVVDSGDFVAMLDHSGVEELLATNKDELETNLRSFEDAKIDTNINLSNLRDGLLNSKVDVEEKQLILEQSQYESPAVVRQAKLDLERAKRNLEQEDRNYELKRRQEAFKVQRAYQEVSRQQEKVEEIEKLLDKMEVRAPQSGMVIYDTDRFGNKIKVGSTVSTWRPTFATLPDLTSMISKTFINEIDISRVKVGQIVQVGIDAFPDKVFDGIVRDVANIGQVLPGGDSKVFEVTIKLNGSDPELKPAMTTSNAITVDVLDTVLFVPLETVHQNDSLQFVYVKDGGSFYKQIIDAGSINENYVVINKGISEGDVLLLSMPDIEDEMDLKGIGIYEIQKQRKEQLEKEQKEKLDKDTIEVDKDKPTEGDKSEEGKKRRMPEGVLKQ